MTHSYARGHVIMIAMPSVIRQTFTKFMEFRWFLLFLNELRFRISNSKRKTQILPDVTEITVA